MARLRRNNKERPPQTIHVHVTIDQRETLELLKKDNAEPIYKVLSRVFEQLQEFDVQNHYLRESLNESRMLRKQLEERIQVLEAQGREHNLRMPVPMELTV